MNAHPHTPTMSVMDPRALAIRSVGYCRRPDETVIESRITRQVFDEAGRLVESWDPRLWASASQPNLATVYGLSGQPVLTKSVDAGWQLSLLDHVGSLHSSWDGRGNQRQCEYDNQQRLLSVTEQAAQELPRVVERLTYGGSAPAFAVHNQCAALIRHDNPASTRFVTDYGLPGSQLSENQCFLIDLEPPDWPSELEARDALLEDQSFATRYVFSPTGEIQRQTDAMGNDRTFGYDVAGKLSETWLLLAGEGRQPQQLVSNIRYNAHDQIESEIAGNGVKTQAEYGADDGRLIRLVATTGSQKPLQDLSYVYDPVGNIVELEDKAQSVTWFNNQRIEPINRYRYDSLYQLIEAKGWEVANPSHGPALPDLLPTPLDPNQRCNYTQSFAYDRAGNLITRHHSGAAGFSMFTSARSNRSLAQWDDGSLPGESDIESGFDASGNQLELQRGQAMTWEIRNQLSRVTLVKREGEPDDYECYAYDRPGHRLRKVHFNQASGRTRRTEVRYLPGLELHRQSDGKEHHVISIEAGRCSVRALHWPEGAHADQLRYSLCDHLGSSTLELDHEAGVLTQEHYYPFGGTACWAGKSAVVAKYKTIRYSGKERDATGLYYFGYRYYAPWLQRWLSADPFGVVDGLNVYSSMKNNPVIYLDLKGTRIFHFSDDSERDEKYRLDKVNVVIGFDIPKMKPGGNLANYLRQSQPGNSFTGVINITSGEVNIYPLSLDFNSSRKAEKWQTPYEGLTHDNGEPIMHNFLPAPGADGLTSHEQIISIYRKDVRDELGFTLRDVRHLKVDDEKGYSIPAIKTMSRSVNKNKIYLVPDSFVSVGANKDDYENAHAMYVAALEADVPWRDIEIKPIDELPTEVTLELANMFARVSAGIGENASSFSQLFDAELKRPELQLPESTSVQQPYLDRKKKAA